ncbi:MAG: TatD family hydrolase, partial [Spirochaetota bacterium]
GKRNRPSYLAETAKFIAELREEDLEEMTETVFRNTLTLFGIEDK